MGVYLLHSSKPLVRSNGEVVKHYLGWCSSGQLPRRLHEHETGRHSAKIVQAFLRLGGELSIGNYWPKRTRYDEVQMKKNGHLSRLCKVCELEQLTREWMAMINLAVSESEFDEVLRGLSRCDPQPPSTSTPSKSNGSSVAHRTPAATSSSSGTRRTLRPARHGTSNWAAPARQRAPASRSASTRPSSS